MTQNPHPVHDDLEIPEAVLQGWQLTVDLLAKLTKVPAALVMRVHEADIEVFVSSQSPGNAYRVGERNGLGLGLYCETVIKTKRRLLVPNATKDPKWDHNPDLVAGMISYCGLPLVWPDGASFGTICMLDDKENPYSEDARELLTRLRDSVQLSLEHVYASAMARRQAIEASTTLAQSEARFHRFVDLAPIPLCYLKENGAIEYVNARFVNLFGYTAQAVPTLEEWVSRAFPDSKYRAWARRTWSRVVADASLSGADVRPVEYEVVCADGTRRTVEISGVMLGNDVLVTFVDLTDRKRAEVELRRLATHDELTGLANRATLIEEIDHALLAQSRTGHKTAVLMLDLDRFKIVNDSLGHEVGDELLRAAARRLEGVARPGDVVARVAGDHFAVVMRDLRDPGVAADSASRIVRAFRERFVIRGDSLYATASLGIAISSETTQTVDLLREADTAMFLAKSQGRDRVSAFREDLLATVVARLTVESELRRAVEARQFTVWYQPEVDLSTGEVVAAEALLRWRHPDGQVYPASRFIDVAEETGLILELGDWVLREACIEAVKWSRARPERPLVVRVNLSTLQLNEDGLIEAIEHALASSGLDPTLLCVEITETGLLLDTDTVRSNIRGIRAKGIGIAVDDFGTGFASLAYLRKYEVDVLKIDRSFVAEVTTEGQSRGIVRGIVALADALGISVTGEGVEDRATATALRDLGCPTAQGYLYAEAVAPDRFISLMGQKFDVS